tara:strand:- start:544 stop:879 length:336 start_codon:yes stop_codon:yes gene_type:complete
MAQQKSQQKVTHLPQAGDTKAPASEAQYQWAMSTISSSADCARSLCVDLMQDIPFEAESASALLLAVEVLLEKIGCIADQHAAGHETKGGSADWLLPPAYHKAAEAQEATS